MTFLLRQQAKTCEAIVSRALQAVSEGVSEVWLTSEDTGLVSHVATVLY